MEDNQIQKTKPNCCNTINKLFLSDEEFVKKLSLYTFNKSNSKAMLVYMKRNPNNDIKSESKGFSMLKGILPNIIMTEPYDHESKYKYICKNRLENQSYETQMEKKRKLFDELIKECKLEKNKTTKLITSIQKEIQDLTMTIEFYLNFDSYFNMQDRLKKSIETVQYESFLGLSDYKDKKKKMEEDWERMNKLRSHYLKSNQQRENEVKEKQGELAAKKKLKEDFISKLDEIKLKTKSIQMEAKEVKNELMIHYHNLLNEAKDTRKDGIMWIVKAIWDLGYDIIVSYLPNFLDDKSIAFVFKYTLKDIDYQRIRSQIDEIKLKVKVNKAKNITFKTDMSLKLDLRESRSSSQPILTRMKSVLDKANEDASGDDKPLTINKYDESFKTKINEDTLVSLKFINVLEKQAEKVKNEITQMKNKELDRILKEFLMHDYERRFSVKLDQVISALIGEDHTANEFAHQSRLQKDFYQSIKKCKTYNFLENMKLPLKIKTQVSPMKNYLNMNINYENHID